MGSIEEKLDLVDQRVRKIEQKMFNGMSDTLAKLETKLPHLMTVEEHERMEEVRRLNNLEIGKRKDRNIRIMAMLIPIVTTLLVWALGRI